MACNETEMLQVSEGERGVPQIRGLTADRVKRETGMFLGVTRTNWEATTTQNLRLCRHDNKVLLPVITACERVKEDLSLTANACVSSKDYTYRLVHIQICMT